MSQIAEKERTKLQRWAMPGGFHDKLVRSLRVVLPSLVGLLLAVMLFSPFQKSDELSFVLDKQDVAMAKERMRLTTAFYRGEDSKGRLFSLTAGSAVQKSSAEPLLRMTDLQGKLNTANGTATISAGQSIYDLQAELMQIPGQLVYNSGDGYNLVASNVEMALKTRSLKSMGPVAGSTKVGSFSAGRMSADLDSRVVRLEGGVHLRIDQNAVR